jgi:ABC-type phosphate/phosphonate transport system substrate-binding protein
MESETGWSQGSTKGMFVVTKKEALEFVEKNKPGLGIMDPPLYFEQRKSLNLVPIMQVESRNLVSEKLHVVVKDPAIKTLEDLKGRRLWSTLGDYPKYISRIVLQGKVDAASHFILKQVGQALKGVRGVLRGDCDATLLDDDQLARAREMEGGGDLKVIYTSPVLPPIPVVIVGNSLAGAEVKALTKAMRRMCGTESGGAICREMHIGRFLSLNEKLFTEAGKLYGE